MAIAFDNASTKGGTTVATLQWTHTCTGANTYMLVASAAFNQTALSAVAYNAVALTKKAAVIGSESVELWRLAGPPTGTLTLSANSVAAATDTWAFGAVTYTGVSQATPDGAASTATAAAASVGNLSVSTTASMRVFGCVEASNPTFTNPAGQNLRFTISQAANVTLMGCDKIAAGGTTSFSWTANAAVGFAMAGIGFSQTASGAVVQPFTKMLTGAGK